MATAGQLTLETSLLKNRRIKLPALLMAAVLVVAAPLFAAEQTSGGEVSYSDSWGPATGTALPLLDAQDHTGTQVALADLVGRKGLVLVLVRSADW